MSKHLQLLLESVLQAALNSVEVLIGGGIVRAGGLATSEGKILSHNTININGVDTGLLEALGKGNDVGGVVELATLDETTGPGKDGGNGVGRGLVALLMLTVVASDSTVGGLRLEGLAIGGNEDRGHETERAKALGDNIRLNVTVVVYGMLAFLVKADKTSSGIGSSVSSPKGGLSNSLLRAMM